MDMRLFLLGGTGGTGREILAQAKARGHSATTFGRSPGNNIAGTPLDANAIAAAIGGHDAVLSAIGAAPFEKTQVRAESARAVLTAMQRNGMRRFVVMSSTLVDGGFFAATLLRRPAADQRSLETIVRASDADWTILRPPLLTNGPLTGTVQLATSRSKTRKVSRSDVAKLMIDLAESGAHKREVVWINA